MYNKHICKIVIYNIFVISLSYCNVIMMDQQLNNISKKIFENYIVQKVDALYLDKCSIKNIDENSFQNMILLTLLELEHNSIEYLPDTVFFDLKSLKHLELNNNSIQSLDPNIFQNNINLEIIDLEENKIEDIPEELFSNLKLLKSINLSKNNIKKIHSNTFINNGMLKHVLLAENLIEDIPKNLFHNLRFLEELYISDNKIKILDSNLFNNCTHLRILRLGENLIEIIPNNLFSNDNKNIIINDSDLLNTGDPTLWRIELNNNDITELKSGTLTKLNYLYSINLSSNKISYIEKNAFPSVSTLHEIYLNNNKLQYLDADIILNSPGIIFLTLYDNPWNCDKNFEKMLTAFKKLHVARLSVIPQCSQPRKLANRTWDTIDEKDLVDSSPPNLMVTPKVLKSEVGETVVFSCRIIDNYDLNITNINWKYNNNTINLKHPEKYFIQTQDKHETAWYNVTLNNVQKQDGGKYTCIYETEDDVIEEEIQFSVYDIKTFSEEKPFLTMLYESNLNATVSENVKLPCLGTGLPEESVVWSFVGTNGSSLNDNFYILRTSPAPNNAVWYNLTLFDVTTENTGTYKCESNIVYNRPFVYKIVDVVHLFIRN